MCLKSVAVTGTPLLFNNTLSVRLELGYCPTVTIFPENCAHNVHFKIHKRPLSFVVVLSGWLNPSDSNVLLVYLFQTLNPKLSSGNGAILYLSVIWI